MTFFISRNKAIEKSRDIGIEQTLEVILLKLKEFPRVIHMKKTQFIVKKNSLYGKIILKHKYLNLIFGNIVQQ